VRFTQAGAELFAWEVNACAQLRGTNEKSRQWWRAFLSGAPHGVIKRVAEDFSKHRCEAQTTAWFRHLFVRQAPRLLTNINHSVAGYVVLQLMFYIFFWDGKMAFGQRKSERIHFQHEHIVNLMGVDGTWRRACVLKDISASGARLEVEGSTEVLRSREFFMVLSTTGVAFRRCELVWIDGSIVGVRFVLNAGKKEKGEAGAGVLNSMLPSNMRLICARSVPAIDADSLECREAKEALFRQGDGFLLYLSDGAPHSRERLLSLGCREALIWLNESEQDGGSFWA
jgi:hypothetical protein